MITYGIFNPGSFVAPSPPINIFSINDTIKYLRLLNNSPYQLSVNLGGNIVNISEFWQKDIAIGSILPSFVTIIPSLAISSSSHSQASQLTVQGLVAGDGGGILDGAIPQQAVTATATGKPLFSASFGLGTSAGNNQSLNIFNPANSGVVATFNLAQGFTNSSGIPTANLIYLSGADLNFATAVAAQSHTGTGAPPVSAMHCTFDDSNSGFGGTAIRVSRLTGSAAMATSELLPFPSQFTLYPGGNLRLSIADTTAGHTVEINLEWTEDTVIPAILVLGPSMVANAIKNDGNAPGTSLIEATPNDLFVSAIQIFNDGTGVWYTDHAGAQHKVFTFNNTGNSLQLAQVGDTAEVLGQFLIDQLLTCVAGLTLTGGKITTPSSGGTPTLSRVQSGFNAVVTTGTVITHNMGVQPNIVLVTPTALTNFSVTAVGTTTFTITVGANCNAYWAAYAV